MGDGLVNRNFKYYKSKINSNNYFYLYIENNADSNYSLIQTFLNFN